MSCDESTLQLTTGWRFGRFAPATEDGPGADEPGFDDGGLAEVTVPHTVVELGWRDWDPQSWEGEWIYRNRFDAPQSDGRRTFLDFGAALAHARPSLNGTDLEDHLGGYLPFSREVTGLITQRDNLLTVRLDSSFNLNVPPCRPAPFPPTATDYWQPGGLYRPVTVRTVPEIFVSDLFAKPVDVLDPQRRRLEITCTVDAAAVAEATKITIEVTDAGGGLVASTDLPVSITRPGIVTADGVVDGLSDIALWDVEDPNLYKVTAALVINGQARHSRSTRIGFREARFAMDGFYLNGRRLQIFGANRHQHYPYVGFAMPARVQRKDAEILRRELNCNMVRCSHYPQSEAFYDACDELGLMAWEEAPGWGYLGDQEWKELAYRDVGEMVRRDRNHPSIIIWGARLNETDDDNELYTRTRDLAHELDGSRPTAGAMAGRLDTKDYVHEVFSEDDYNSSIGADGRKQPEFEPPRADRPYLISECVGTLSGPELYYRRFGSQIEQQGQALAHARVHDLAAADPHFCGVIVWTSIDYESGSGANIDHGVKCTGVVDLFRIAKPGAAFYHSQLDPAVQPVISPAFYWDFGTTSPTNDLGRAMICSNLDRLEIFVGGTHFGTVEPDRATYPNLAHPPSFVDFGSVDPTAWPELRIDGYLGNELALSRTFSSDPATDSLSLRVDDQELVADGADATRVEFRAVDRYGAPRPYVSGDVTLQIDGPVELIGKNPFPFAAAGGAGAVWIRATQATGGVRIRAEHPILGEAETSIMITARRETEQ